VLLNVVRRSLALRITGGPQGPSDDGITCLEAALASDNPLGALVDLCWAPTDLVAADVLTKNLGAAKFRRFQAFLLNLPATQPVRELVTKLITGFR
jgi:hypothetical protein